MGRINTVRSTSDVKTADRGLDQAAHPGVPLGGSPFGKGVRQAYGPDKLHGLKAGPQTRHKKLPK